MDYTVIVAYALGLLLLYFIARALVVPVRFFSSLVYNAAIGGVLLWVLNLVGGLFNLHVALNPATAVAVGFLGVPGLALIVALERLVF